MPPKIYLQQRPEKRLPAINKIFLNQFRLNNFIPKLPEVIMDINQEFRIIAGNNELGASVRTDHHK